MILEQGINYLGIRYWARAWILDAILHYANPKQDVGDNANINSALTILENINDYSILQFQRYKNMSKGFIKNVF